MQLYVRLDRSENSLLPQPCYGLLEIVEAGPCGNIVSAIFRQMANGKLSAPVAVRRPKFTYSNRMVVPILTEIAAALREDSSAQTV